MQRYAPSQKRRVRARLRELEVGVDVYGFVVKRSSVWYAWKRGVASEKRDRSRPRGHGGWGRWSGGGQWWSGDVLEEKNYLCL